MMPVVSLQGVSKKYRIYSGQRERLKEILSFGKVQRGHDFWALNDVGFEVKPGTALGILGRNGAGKSTLLKIISGVLQPTSGSVSVNGRLAALLQLGAGFNSEFTGRENVLMNGLILGLDRREMLEKFDEIAAFADIGEFMEQPVKTYSSGMRARLGFAVAVNVEPDILIVDETLSVGDAIFRHMGLQKMLDLRDRGTTILFVTHGLGMIRNFCSEALLLHKGAMVSHGETAETLDRYKALLSSTEAQKTADVSGSDGAIQYDIDEDTDMENGGYLSPTFKKNPDLERRVSTLRHGTGEARISNVELLGKDGTVSASVASDSTVTVRVHVEYLKEIESSILSITLRNKGGLDVFSTSTTAEKTKLGGRAKGERVVVDFTFDTPLQHGTYSISAAVSHSQNKSLYLDWLDVATVFDVERPVGRPAYKGLFNLPTKVEIHGASRRDKSA